MYQEQKNIEKSQNQSKISLLINSHLPDYNLKDIQIKHLSGLTNQTYKVSCKGFPSLIFRIFSQLGDRQMQNIIYSVLQSKGIAPKCFFANQKYRIQLYIENCRHPTLDQLKDKNMQQKIMKLLQKFHKIQMNQLKQSQSLFSYALSLQYYQKVLTYKNIKNDSNFQKLQQLFKTTFSNIDSLKQKLAIVNQKSLVFCHNDLNNLNIFVEPQIQFIDFQYCSYNYLAYDIANFLNQSTINYSHKQFPFFKLQRSIQRQEINAISQFYGQKYQNMENDIIKALVVCNLYWAGWSLIMANNQSQKGFGTVDHGLMRMNQFNHYLTLIN